jgi:hypothetical protein
MFGFIRILDKHDATRLFDGAHPDCSIRSGASENDSESIAHPFSHGTKEQIDSRAFTTRLLEFRSRNLMVGYQQSPIGRNDIYVVRLYSSSLV